MRLWHQDLIPHLPRQQLLGQHRECCALRGAGWGKKHSVVNYVFTYKSEYLVAYHCLIIDEMVRRGYKPDPIWRKVNWRGNTLQEQDGWCDENVVNFLLEYTKPIYSEHNEDYLKECLDNLAGKGIIINMGE